MSSIIAKSGISLSYNPRFMFEISSTLLEYNCANVIDCPNSLSGDASFVFAISIYWLLTPVTGYF